LVLSASIDTRKRPSEIVTEQGFVQLSDEAELQAIAEAVVAGNPKAVEDYRAGKKQALQALMADLRKRAPQANPKVASGQLLKLLG
jgi:aspartyl-tRNA(Asn)/glutamyl-tRNA(Gln) amidotransferase subunit B